MNQTYLIIGIILIVISIVIALVANKNNNGSKGSLPFEIDELIELLGSIENIEDVSNSRLRVNFKLVDSDKVEVEKIKELGASGIVETSEGVSLIFGDISEIICELVKVKL